MSANSIMRLMRFLVVVLLICLSIMDDNLILIHIVLIILGYDVFVKLPLYVIGAQTNKLGYDIECEKTSAAPLLVIYWLGISIIISAVLYRLGIC